MGAVLDGLVPGLGEVHGAEDPPAPAVGLGAARVRAPAPRTTPHAWPMAAKPSTMDIDSDSSDTPCLPASRGPDGETMAATATSEWGWV